MKYTIILASILFSILCHANTKQCSEVFQDKPRNQHTTLLTKKKALEDFKAYLASSYPSEAGDFSKLAKSRILRFQFRNNTIKITPEEYYKDLIYLSEKLFLAKLSSLSKVPILPQIPLRPSSKVNRLIETLIAHLHKQDEISLNAIFAGIQDFNPQLYTTSAFSILIKGILTQSLNKFHLLDLLRTDRELQGMINSHDYDGLRSYLKKHLSPVAHAEWVLHTSTSIFTLSFSYVAISIVYALLQGEDFDSFLPVFNIHLVRTINGEGSDSLWNFASLLNYYTKLNQYANNTNQNELETQYFNELRKSGALQFRTSE